MTALFELIPGKVYVVLIAILLAFGYYEYKHIEAIGASHEVAALQASSVKLTEAAQAQVQETATNYAAVVAAITEREDANTQIAHTQLSNDAVLLRDYDAYRDSHPALGAPAGAGSAAGSGDADAARDDGEFKRLEQVALELAGSVYDAGIALTSCIDERNALTGR